MLANDVLSLLQVNSFRLSNLANGEWITTTKSHTGLVSPLNGMTIVEYPDTQVNETDAFLKGLRLCPKSGLHNPFKNVQRYQMLGEVSFKVATYLSNPQIADYFARLIQQVMPKSYTQCMGEVEVTRQFLKNFSGDQVRFLAEGRTTPGDHLGQQPQDYQWPFGPVIIIAPFNFPLEIPALQLMGALYMGNRPLIKPATKVGVVTEQFLRLLHICGLPKEDVDLIHCSGSVMYKLLKRARNNIRLVQFTGSSEVAEALSTLVKGKIKIEDAGFNWKIIGPDVINSYADLDYITWQCDQDAYAASGQKCSAQSILFSHINQGSTLITALKQLANKRKLDNLTIGPVLTWTTEEMLAHIEKLSKIPGVELIFGGKPLKNHKIPECYGAIEPTAVFVPLESIANSFDDFRLATKEVFGPVQVITTYENSEIPIVLELCERMNNHLTAAVVSRDQEFIDHIIASTVNGTTYAGIRARTTGAPQNHWFGPSGDPRGAGIGTPEAIRLTWSSTRCINRDTGPIDHSKELVQS